MSCLNNFDRMNGKLPHFNQVVNKNLINVSRFIGVNTINPHENTLHGRNSPYDIIGTPVKPKTVISPFLHFIIETNTNLRR